MRVHQLDYLRGFMALSIMLYHYFSWTYVNESFESDSILGIIGIYGVSIFYIISGLALYIVYENKLQVTSTPSFFIKRVFRILPLLCLSILLNMYLFDLSPGFRKVFLNMTGLFGFFDHAAYITTGSWSIGNEIVFYTIFPLLLFSRKINKHAMEFIFVITILIAFWFAFSILRSKETFGEVWPDYINPFNQLFLFVGGVIIGKRLIGKKNNRLSLGLLALAILILVVYKVSGSQLNIVTGWNRFVFSAVSFMLVISFLVNDLKIPKFLNFVLVQIGHISYSVYLLHAIVFWYVAIEINRVETPELFLFYTISYTILFALLSYYLIEKNFIWLGRILANWFTRKLQKN